MRTDDHPAVDGATPASSLAHRFATALAARDAAALRSLFASEVDFRALTPGRVWEARTANEVIDEVILGSWFEPGDVVEQVESVQHGQVGTRTRIGYRLRVESAGQAYTVEQQAYCDLSDGKITWLRVLCSGFVPTDAAAGTDAGAAGNSDTHLEGTQT